jgi:hypothetical protein
MTQEELEQIQTICHEWLRQPGTSNGSCMTIPAGGALLRPVELEVRSLLTFDNVMITSAVDAVTGVCYSKLIARSGEPGEFIDAPLESVTSSAPLPEQERPAALRATQERYQDAMKRSAESRADEISQGDPSATGTNAWWIEKASPEADEQPKYLLYTSEELLGYSLLERTRSQGQVSGRFYPGENYFAYATLFENLSEAENDCMEATAREAYEIEEAGDDQYRKRFNELLAQASALELHVKNEDGLKIEAVEVRLDDLSRYYNDQTERWLSVTLGPTAEDEA